MGADPRRRHAAVPGEPAAEHVKVAQALLAVALAAALSAGVAQANPRPKAHSPALQFLGQAALPMERSFSVGALGLDALGIPLDNVEGMTLGPELPDGRRSLILVSDNNFAPSQFTQFLLFALSPRA
jgi:hypothetical protein